MILAACSRESQPPTAAETFEKIQACVATWRPECAELDFSPLNGIERKDLRIVVGQSRVVCEEDATAEHCVKVRWRAPLDESH